MNILVVNDIYYKPSETFIKHQVEGITDAKVFLAAYTEYNTPENKPHLPVYVVKKFGVNVLDKLLIKLKGGNHYTIPPLAQKHLREFIIKNKIDVIQCHYGFNGLRMLPVARALNLPLVVSFHGIDASQLIDRDLVYQQSLKNLFAYAKYCIAVSPVMQQTLIKNGLPAQKCKLIRYGVDLNNFTCRPYHANQNNTTTILHVGRFTGKKGVPDLVKAAHLMIEQGVADFELILIGFGEEEEEVKGLIKKYGLENKIVLAGSKNHTQVKEAMQAADIFVLNSRVSNQGDMEGSPNVILEAMATGLPVVSTLHSGIPYMVDDGVNGFLVPERDNNMLAQKLATLINDPELRQQMGLNARTKAEKEFSQVATLNKLNQLLREAAQ